MIPARCSRKLVEVSRKAKNIRHNPFRVAVYAPWLSTELFYGHMPNDMKAAVRLE